MLDPGEQVRDTVVPDFRTDEGDIPVPFGLPGEMLAGAESDLQPQPAAPAEIDGAIAADDDAQARQQPFDQGLAML